MSDECSPWFSIGMLMQPSFLLLPFGVRGILSSWKIKHRWILSTHWKILFQYYYICFFILLFLYASHSLYYIFKFPCLHCGKRYFCWGWPTTNAVVFANEIIFLSQRFLLWAWLVSSFIPLILVWLCGIKLSSISWKTPKNFTSLPDSSLLNCFWMLFY